MLQQTNTNAKRTCTEELFRALQGESHFKVSLASQNNLNHIVLKAKTERTSFGGKWYRPRITRHDTSSHHDGPENSFVRMSAIFVSHSPMLCGLLPHPKSCRSHVTQKHYVSSTWFISRVQTPWIRSIDAPILAISFNGIPILCRIKHTASNCSTVIFIAGKLNAKSW